MDRNYRCTNDRKFVLYTNIVASLDKDGVTTDDPCKYSCRKTAGKTVCSSSFNPGIKENKLTYTMFVAARKLSSRTISITNVHSVHSCNHLKIENANYSCVET